MIGCFRYLNAYPFRRLLERGGVPYRLFEDPKSMAQAWRQGEVNAALLPIRYVGRFREALPWGIASAGPIQSVLLLSDYPPTRWQALIPDAASTSSVALLTWLMKQGYFPSLPIQAFSNFREVGRLFIGDSALRWKSFYPYLKDVGALAAEKVQTPFVYAVWCARGKLHAFLRRLFRQSWDFLTWAEEAALGYRMPAPLIYAYWQNIHYGLSRKAVYLWRRRLSATLPEIPYL